MRRFITLLLLMLTVLSPVWGRTVKWAITPKYDRLERYCDGVYKYHQGHQCGLITTMGDAIADAIADSITPVDKNGVALLLTASGKLKGLYNARMRKVIPMGSDYTVNLRDAFFSEGLMPVKKGDKWGYINTEGNLAIKCSYSKALPFSEGKAPVTLKDRRVIFINEDGEMALRTSFNNNELGFATPFVNGVAYIGFNDRYAMIDGQGKVKEKFNLSELPSKIPGPEPKYQEMRQPSNRIDAYQNSNKWGYSGILPAQLDAAEPFYDGLAIVRLFGKMGVLQLVNGDFGLNTDNTPVTIKNNKAQDYVLRLRLPAEVDLSSMAFRLNKGDDEMKAVKPTSIEQGVAVFKFTPKVQSKAAECNLGIEVAADGLTLFSASTSVKVTRPVTTITEKKEKVDGHKNVVDAGAITLVGITTSGRADSKGIQTITGTVKNTTSKSVKATLTANGQSATVTVPPTGKSTSVTLKIKVTKMSSCKVTLSAGGKNMSNTIKLVPFQ